MCATCRKVLRGPEEGIGFLRAGVKGDYPKWMLEIGLGPLEEQHILLSIELFLQLLVLGIFGWSKEKEASIYRDLTY